MKVQYVGQYEEVTVPMPGRGEAYVRQGEVLDTTDAHGDLLLAQPANWAPYAAPVKPKAAEKSEEAPQADPNPNPAEDN